MDVTRLGEAVDAVARRHPGLRGASDPVGVMRRSAWDEHAGFLAYAGFPEHPVGRSEHAAGPELCATLSGPRDGRWRFTLAGPRLDGWSLRLLCEEIEREYAATAPVRSSSPDQEAWTERLAGAPAQTTWPYDPGLEPGDALGAVPVEVTADLAAAVRRQADCAATTPLAVFAAVTQLLMARVGPRAGLTADVVVGAVAPAVGREEERRPVADPSGVIPLRQSVDPDAPFGALLRGTAGDLSAGLRRGALPPGRGLPVQVTVEVDGEAPPRLRLGSAVAKTVEIRTPWPGGDLRLVLRLDGAGYLGRLEYARARYTEATARTIVTSFLTLLADALARPGIPAGDLALVPRPRAVVSAAPAVAQGLRVHEMVAETVRHHPDLPALRWPGGELTYRELHARSGALAARLAGARMVALCARRAPELPVAILAALRAGAAYVPLDATYPLQRLDYMLGDSGADVLVGHHDLVERLTVPDGCRIVTLDGLPEGADDAGGHRRAGPDDLAYVIYTSGSTGLPKGVAMPHGPVAGMVDWQRRRSDAGIGWNTLQFAPVSFDVSFQELFATWSTGGTVVLVDEERRRDPRALLDYLEIHRIHRLFLPFVALRLLAETAVRLDRYPSHLREVITAGEQLKVTSAVRTFFARTGAGLENQYGPTEAHPASAEPLPADPATWPALPAIGRPRDGAVLEVLDARLRPLPPGVPGQLCVSGPVIAAGYLGRPDLTAERFPDHPDRDGRVYLTGDIGRVLPDGRAEFIGRADNQIKIRGYRVEIGEVEARLGAVPGIADAAVVAADGPDGPYLVAHCVAEPGDRPSVRELRARLAEALPDYMIPARYAFTERLPLGPSGKVDRAALSAAVPAEEAAEHDVPPQAADARQDHRGPVGGTEEMIAAVWSELLELRRPEPDVSLFELGGTSLTATRLAARLEELFGTVVPVAELFTHDTIAAQARLVERLFETEIAQYASGDVLDVLDELVRPGE